MRVPGGVSQSVGQSITPVSRFMSTTRFDGFTERRAHRARRSFHVVEAAR
jgi:hypothetical protein